MKTTLGLIRHGVTDWNVQKRIQGATDIPLNEEGIQQARLLAARLKHEDWKFIYTSDLSRAYKTAQIIAEAMEMPKIEKDHRLREKSFGEAEGTTEPERIARWGEQWREHILGAETHETVRRRIKSLLDEWLRRHAGERILVVTHGAWIVNFLEGFLDTEKEIPYIGNTSVTVVEYQDNRWVAPLVGCQSHLTN